jgi:tRNA-Thr(GGU) m(6)t(6)A37 methyltransferase TsaA
VDYVVHPIGFVESPLRDRSEAPRQGNEGAPEAWVAFDADVEIGLKDLRAGDEVLLLTWLDQSDRDVLVVHPRDDLSLPETGVFSTRSSDRPNPIGIHRVEVKEIKGLRVRVINLEAIDGTPIIDVKPVLDQIRER